MSTSGIVPTAVSSSGWNPSRLEAAVAELGACAGRDGIDELVIADTSRVLWRGPGAARVHGLWSCTKSFLSTCLGLLIDEGRISLNTPLIELVPEVGEEYGNACLGHFANMTSGYRAVGDDHVVRGYRHGPSAEWHRSAEPLFRTPGSAFAYWDSAMNVLAWALTRAAGRSLKTLFQVRIASHLGWPLQAWDWPELVLPSGERVCGGAGNLDGHVKVSADQFVTFGRFLLQRGCWSDRQLLSEAWIQAASQNQVGLDLGLGFSGGIGDGRGIYGFGWWVNGCNLRGHRRWPGVPTTTFSASGYNNNDAFIVPEWSLVVVRFGLDQDEREITAADYAAFLRKLGDARFPV